MKPQLPDGWKNLKNTLDYIEHSPAPPSRANIAAYLSLSRTTASSLAAQLISAGIVEELDSEVNGRGRPGIPLHLSTRRWYALGAAFSGDEWLFLIVDMKGNIKKEHTEKAASFSVNDFTRSLLRGLSYMVKRKPGPLLPLIGIGSPGLVNSDTGEIISADDMDWHGVALGELVLKHTGIPALIMNRHRASGLAEARFGIGRNTDNLIYIGVGTGISAALISNGVLLEGTSFSAGEIGHTVIDPKGPLCGCGRHGCLQAMASSQALVRIARKLHASLVSRGAALPFNPLWDILHDNSMISGELIGIEANNGNMAALECMQKIAEYLGLAVGNLINTMNPRKIIIGGSLGNTGPLLTKLISQEAAKHAMPTPMAAVTVEQGLLGNRASALGATCLPLLYKLEILAEEISRGNS
jgi:predicted NBD/HSP70 family sugar kinase